MTVKTLLLAFCLFTAFIVVLTSFEHPDNTVGKVLGGMALMWISMMIARGKREP